MAPTSVVRLTDAPARPVAVMSPASALAVTWPARPDSDDPARIGRDLDRRGARHPDVIDHGADELDRAAIADGERPAADRTGRHRGLAGVGDLLGDRSGGSAAAGHRDVAYPARDHERADRRGDLVNGGRPVRARDRHAGAGTGGRGPGGPGRGGVAGRGKRAPAQGQPGDQRKPAEQGGAPCAVHAALITPRSGHLGTWPGSARPRRRTSAGSAAWRSRVPRRGTACTRARSRPPSGRPRSAPTRPA